MEVLFTAASFFHAARKIWPTRLVHFREEATRREINRGRHAMRRSNRSKARRTDEAGRTRGLPVAGEVLRSLRLARKWTQSAAAERADISDRLIRKAESGGPID